MPVPPALLLDIDGTLVDTATAEDLASRDVVAGDSVLRGIDPAQFLALWRSHRSTWTSARLDGTVPLSELRLERMIAVLDVLGVPGAKRRGGEFAERLARATLAHCRAFPDVRALHALSMHHPLAVVTNGDPVYQRAKLRSAGIDLPFAAFVASIDLGACKPQPTPFLAAARMLSRDPGSCIHVGDSVRDDVEASIAAGMTGILLDRKVRTLRGAWLRIHSLDALSDAIEAIVRARTMG